MCSEGFLKIQQLTVVTLRKQCQSYDYLKWLCYTHNAAHIVAIVTQDKVP